MKKLIFKNVILGFILISSILFTGKVLYDGYIHYITPQEIIIDPVTSHTIDSLNNIIKLNNLAIKNNNSIVDSVSNNKLQIINKYETTIKNYSNVTIISDDSVSKFIAKELYNWK